MVASWPKRFSLRDENWSKGDMIAKDVRYTIFD